MKTEKKVLSYCVEETLKAEVTQNAFNELLKFLELLIELKETASKKTHYHDLDKWNNKVYGFVHDCLNKFGFINGGAAMRLEQPRDANFWWNIYIVVGNVCNSLNLKTQVSSHHSSAWERNEALIADVYDIIDYKDTKSIITSDRRK